MSKYIVKVKKSADKTYLWGGENIQHDLVSPLFFTFRVMDMGEPIDVATEGEDGKSLGTLKENETFTIHLNKIKGIWAKCVVGGEPCDTKVECFIESITNNG